MAGRLWSMLTPKRCAILIWMVAATAMLIVKSSAIVTLDTIDPDDALRLVQVRDLLAGQDWWEVGQHRINPAGGGGLMHWSRIVDAPIAGGIWILRPLAGQALAEQLVLALWPLAMLGALLTLAARCFARLAGDSVAMAALVLLASDYIILFQFAPLRIDHHGWQILLTLAMLSRLIRPPDTASGVASGALAAVLISISLEGLPAIALFAAIMATEWLWTGSAGAWRRLASFLTVLTLAAAVLQFITRGHAALIEKWCDALSLPYLGAFAVAAAAISAAPLATSVMTTRSGRLILLAGAACLSAAALVTIAPACAAGPFGTLDPVVVDYWYVNVFEGRPIWTGMGPMFAFTGVPMLIGLAGTLGAWRCAEDAASRRMWLVTLAALAGTSAIGVLVMRASSIAHVLAMPGCAWLIIAAWQRARKIKSAGPRIVATLGAALLAPPLAGIATAQLLIDRSAIAANAASNEGGGRPVVCVDAVSSAALNRLPPATVLAPLDIGPHLLQRTHHSVTATGHHRNNAVMKQTILAFIGDPAAAHSRALSMGATLIIMCPQAIEVRNFRQADGDGLADLLLTGRATDWVEPVPMPAGAKLRVWRIRDRQSPP